MLELTPVLVLLIIFGFVYGVVALAVRKKERQMMIEKGVDPSIFATNRKPTSASLKFGLLFVGVAIGIILGHIMHEYAYMQEEAAYFSMIFLFGGLGLVVDYFLEKRENKTQ